MAFIKTCDLEAEIAGVMTPDTTVFVDFDHTLFACNSTELFVAICRPAFVATVVDTAIRHLVPWRRLLGSQSYRARDLVRCLALVVLCPWSLPLWRRSAPGLLRHHASRTVCQALDPVDPERTIIVSFGVGAIVGPLLRGSRWQDSAIVATPLLPPSGYFRRGKLSLVLGGYSPQAVAGCVFISDSLDDADLLDAAGRGLLIEPQGEAFQARERCYLPLRYTARAKYTPSYLLDQLVLVDMLLLILASVGPAGTLAWQALAWRALVVAGLSFSLTCVYEIGYFENDMVAALLEAAPTLDSRMARFRAFPIEPSAWFWAMAAAAAAGVAGRWSGVIATPGAAAMLGWIAILAALRLLFRVYNGSPIRRRVVLYPFLQAMKYLPVVAVVHATMFGAVMVASQVATMWATYLIYRLGGDKGRFRREEFRTILFVIGAGLLLASSPIAGLGGWMSLALLLAWSAGRLGKAGVLGMVRGRRRASAAG